MVENWISGDFRGFQVKKTRLRQKPIILIIFGEKTEKNLKNRPFFLPPCHEVNEAHSCAAYACIAEGVFIVEVVNAYFGSLGKIDMGHSHYNGFDADSNCGVVNFEREDKNDERARECCGNWPRRYPFRTFDNHRACCGETTYDTTMFQCCAGEDNRVQHYGIQC